MDEILTEGFSHLGLPLAPDALHRFQAYHRALEAGNAVMNLTAITGEADTARLHFLDCAALLTAADLRGARVIDVGTGAGFPGLVLKIRLSLPHQCRPGAGGGHLPPRQS